MSTHRKDAHRVFIGYDANELTACNVAEHSLYRYATRAAVDVQRISRLTLFGKYDRPTTTLPNGQLFDEISDAPMSTDHAIARFHVPRLCEYAGWALFTDGDVLFREDVGNLFALADPQYAVMCVQHPALLDGGTKKAGHIQQSYPRKNWSSVMLMNCGHEANRALTLDVLNSWPGRELHAFNWLRADQIGALPTRWNWLVGISAPDPNPAIVHYTLGVPSVEGHGLDPFAVEWFHVARAAGHTGLAAAFHAEIG